MASTETNGRATTDIDAEETRDWLESVSYTHLTLPTTPYV